MAAAVFSAALIKTLLQAFCNKLNSQLAVGVYSVDEHCHDERWTQLKIPALSQVSVFASERNPIENGVLSVCVND
jgi:hypothetical protein